MQLQSFIFIGRSGCGKGTQAKLLIDRLKQLDPTRKSLYIQTGGELREFIKGNSFTQKIARKLYVTGSLMAEFLTIDMWVTALVNRYSGDDHLVFDGTPRKVHEAQVFDTIFSFYKLSKPWVINLEISHDEALKRLMARKRIDDTEDDIRKRLTWFESEVVPTIEYFKSHPGYNFITIDGERSIEEIHSDIVKRVGLE